MTDKISPVIRIKAELLLAGASRKLRDEPTPLRRSPDTSRHADTCTIVRKELDKLVDILADEQSEKHLNVAARVATCVAYLTQIPSTRVLGARNDMITAHKVLEGVCATELDRQQEAGSPLKRRLADRNVVDAFLQPRATKR